MKLRIVFEDSDVLVVDKPPGLLTSTGPRERRATLLAMVADYFALMEDRQARIGLIHRLDRDASGLLVFSKNPRAFTSLKRQFFAHTVERVYHAVVHGAPSPAEGRVRNRLIELTDGTVRKTRRADAGQEAITDYKTIRTSTESLSLLRVVLQTGRKHQIRAHLSQHCGTPIVNDPMYGGPTGRRRSGRLMLAATSLAFDHPRTGKRVSFEIRLPGEMSALFAAQSGKGTRRARSDVKHTEKRHIPTRQRGRS